MAGLIQYVVTAVDDSGVTIWDQQSSSLDHPDPRYRATMTLPLANPHLFQVGDLVSLALILDERKEQPNEQPAQVG